ncbi:MAG: polar amino acid transport system substrate-binding protein [Oceanospirillaceae bacterium]|jgi:polar amino acid transport system substrate-binding protein
MSVINMWKSSIVIIFVLYFSAFSVSAKPYIKLNIAHNGYPPFMMLSESGKASGIMVDVLQSIVDKKGYELKIYQYPRRRILKSIDSKIIDTYPIAKEWIEHSENYLFSDEVLNMRDVLFSPIKSPVQFDNINNLIGKCLGVHLGFRYPTLKPYFESNRITKITSPSDLSMLEMTLLKRNDASVINELVGLWYIKTKPNFQDKFVRSSTAIDNASYRFIFSKDRKPFVDIFNEELKLMFDSGEVAAIIAKYQ